MKGDYVEVTYKTGAGTAKEKIRAERDGGAIEVTMPRATDRFLEVNELNKVKAPIRVARFASTEVIAVIEGHETIARAGAKAKK